MSHLDELRKWLTAKLENHPEADDILAATYPPACQNTAKGHAHEGCNYNAVHLPIGAWFCNKCGFAIECPDCPTIAQLLAASEAQR